MKRKHHFPQSRALCLISLLVGAACIMPTMSLAAESLFSKARFTDILDGDVQLAPLGHRAGLHMTFGSAPDAEAVYSAAHSDNNLRNGGSGVHLSVRMPWK